ncbi:hypothetical protein J6497_07245 [Bradyrhizobium sp. CNPSo 4026]|nr:hypothetical protein [Bradyrhizobium cenepequi]
MALFPGCERTGPLTSNKQSYVQFRAPASLLRMRKFAIIKFVSNIGADDVHDCGTRERDAGEKLLNG